jgi:hypothetical protein
MTMMELFMGMLVGGGNGDAAAPQQAGILPSATFITTLPPRMSMTPGEEEGCRVVAFTRW